MIYLYEIQKSYVIKIPITDDEIKYQLILYANEKKGSFPQPHHKVI